MKMGVQISVQVPAFNSFGYIPTSARSYGNFLFNFLRKCHTLFHSGYTIYILASNAQGYNFSLSSPTLGIFCFLKIVAILVADAHKQEN